MIESFMYFAIGFLFAAISVLVVSPLIHGRAVRLTTRRLEATIPLSMTEVQTDKDLLRAEFALSTRRLEMNVEQLKTKSVSQLAELGRKGDAINRLKIELGTRSASCAAVALLSALDQSPGWTAAIDRIHRSIIWPSRATIVPARASLASAASLSIKSSSCDGS
jgi:hypothetical protein